MKMKMINENMLIEFLNREKDHWPIDSYTGDRMAFLAHKTLLALFEEFEVEAIPISFIKGLIEELEPAKAAEVDLDKNILEIHSDVVIIQVLKMLIEHWEKENEE